ncbi:MAG: hypothetical protein EAZ62_04095 [Sphingobacteriia bacterium]|nr:MAG: hypothetical protein EAZ62_04095 [Sphingobacteriia bacterium]
MFKILLWGILIYFLYRFIFELVVPVSKATVNMRKAMAEMQRRQAEMQQNQSQQGPASNAKPFTTQERSGQPPAGKSTDYIDFEEVK